MTMIRCAHCGEEVTADTTGCPRCGADPHTGEVPERYVDPEAGTRTAAVAEGPADAEARRLGKTGFWWVIGGFIIQFVPIIPFRGFIALIAAIVGVVYCVRSMQQPGNAPGLAIAGLILGVLGLVFFVAMLIYVAGELSSL